MPYLLVALVAVATSLLHARMTRRELDAWPLARVALLVAAPGTVLLAIAHAVHGPWPVGNALAFLLTGLVALGVFAVALAASGRVVDVERAIGDLKNPALRASAAAEIHRYVAIHQPRRAERDVVYAHQVLVAANSLSAAGRLHDAEAVLAQLPSWAMDEDQLVVRDFTMLLSSIMRADHARARALLAAFPRGFADAHVDCMVRLFEARLLVVEGAPREALSVLDETVCSGHPTARALQLALRSHIFAAFGDESVARALIADLARDYQSDLGGGVDLLHHPLHFWSGAPATAIAHELAAATQR